MRGDTFDDEKDKNENEDKGSTAFNEEGRMNTDKN